MARNPNATFSLTYQDFNGEKSAVTFNARTYNVLTFADDLTDFTDLQSALEGIILGTQTAERVTPFETKFASAPPSNVNAQRERKWLVTYQDVVDFTIYRMEIPTADLTGRLIAGSDDADLTDTNIAAFITQFEAVAKTINGNGTSVLSIKHVGRNL